jgi:hypothetical protein
MPQRSLLTAFGKSIVGFSLANSYSGGDSEPGEPGVERPNPNTAFDDMKRMIRSFVKGELAERIEGWLVGRLVGSVLTKDFMSVDRELDVNYRIYSYAHCG